MEVGRRIQPVEKLTLRGQEHLFERVGLAGKVNLAAIVASRRGDNGGVQEDPTVLSAFGQRVLHGLTGGRGLTGGELAPGQCIPGENVLTVFHFRLGEPERLGGVLPGRSKIERQTARVRTSADLPQGLLDGGGFSRKLSGFQFIRQRPEIFRQRAGSGSGTKMCQCFVLSTLG